MAEKKNTVENTAKSAEENPLGMLLRTVGPGSIEAMEAAGTAQLAESDVLPTEGLDKRWAQASSIVIGAEVEGDPLFTHVTLPAGWRQERTDHGMWNELLDDHGRKRASIFYKAAHYDRRAFISPEPRFVATYERNWNDRDDRRTWPVVKDGGKEAWRGEPVELGRLDPSDTVVAVAEQWLADHGYPDFRDVTAYWDSDGGGR